MKEEYNRNMDSFCCPVSPIRVLEKSYAAIVDGIWNILLFTDAIFVFAFMFNLILHSGINTG
jgi:hypothetical protein